METHHCIVLLSLHDDCEYLERRLVADLAGFQFSYTWHEMIDRGFLFAMPWKQTALKLNEANLNARSLREGMQIQVVRMGWVEFVVHLLC